jgi:FKBP-type peptidyl-prolyl cis-trans isomerase FklB
MRTNNKIAWVATLVTLISIAQTSAVEPPVLKTQMEQQSYAVGVDLIRNFKRQGIQLNSDAMVRGMQDALSGQKLLMTDEQIRTTLSTYQEEIKKKRIQARGGTGALMEENRNKEVAFLAENKGKPGVVSLPSGLQYKILKAGNGPKPGATNVIECHFKGSFIDGTEFNSSQRGGKPVFFKMNDVVAGWKEVWPLMPVGSKFQLFVPSQLAYGEKGVLGARARYQIPPNSMLIFDIELLGVK